ncbi:L-2-amino-thiazoline-4-carboxylic acid hydrolase [Brevibacillus sp. B_LB10_24]|uniref:L-2-amino-thiazoline-4-carboxylic acid hydrolase n=1 Tax=Brevibacillus sp. B_LB10_24 TaxID=3380645 RepID=UPI0038BCC25E
MSNQRTDVIPYNEAVRMVRNAIEDRATWFDLLTKEAVAAGVDPEPIARRAIQRFGYLKSHKMIQTESMEEFVSQFANELVSQVFEMDVKEVMGDHAVVHVHYCPLVESWKKNGNTDEQIDNLCKWAVEGDHGLMENFPDFQFTPEKRIAAGDGYCRFVFNRK